MLHRIKTISPKINWKLLLFLILLLNVKLAVKLLALGLVFLFQPNFRFGFRLKDSRLPLFYPAMMGIAVLNALLYGQFFQLNSGLALALGLSFWALCILAIHQIKLFVERNDAETIHNTLVAFFILNAIVAFGVLLGIIIETGAVNPYRYQGNYQKYFINTGDYIKGLSFDTSTTNAAINAFGVVYFLHRRKMGLVLLCMVTLLLAASNIINLLLFLVLAFVFLFQSVREQKSMIVACLALTVIFLFKISPQNTEYVTASVDKILGKKPKPLATNVNESPITEKPDSVLTAEQLKEKAARLYLDSINRVLLQPKAATAALPMVVEKPHLPKDDIHSQPFQSRNDTDERRKELIEFLQKTGVEKALPPETKSKLPGKVVALQQTARLFRQHPVKLVTGMGMGNFSSKLAFRASGLKMAGGYPLAYVYVHPDFEKNHLALYSHFFSKQAGHHSVANSPYSVADQVLSEYGLLGFACFVFFYLGYFLKHRRKLGYGIPLLLLFGGLIFIDYWFEQLSVIVLLELMLLLNIKEAS
jgi:hypothetical protein